MIRKRKDLLKPEISERLRSLRSGKDEGLTDYRIFRLNSRDVCVVFITALAAAAITAYIFYKSIAAFFLLLPVTGTVAFLYFRMEFRKRRDERLSVEFKDSLSSLSGYISAGYSLENAFLEVYKEKLEGSDRSSPMLSELSHIAKGIRLNMSIEELLTDFSIRSANDDIRSFVQVLNLSKRSGGDLREIVERTAGVIRDKVQVREDIRTATQAVRFEQNIMSVIPIFIILYIDLSSSGFLGPLYNGVAGRAVMTAALIMMAASLIISRKISDIRL